MSAVAGVPINVPDHLPIYAYIVCDLTPTLQKQARDYQLKKTPDSLGYFGYHSEYGAYIEIISFDKLLDDAKKRNKILLNFTSVDFLSSAALGKLITLDKKVKAHGGMLKLSNIQPDIYEVFAITKLNKLFDIRDDEAAALVAFQ